MSDERYDAQIDEVARETTRGELPPDFRARVIARIEREDERRWTWWPGWALSSLAIAAAVLLSVLVVRAPWRSQERVAREVRQQVIQEVGPRPGATDATTASPSPATVRQSPNRAYAGRRTPDATYGGGVASDLSPAPIQIESIGVDAMESMDVAPLSVDAMESIEVPRLDVAPLEVPTVGEE
jgi:hypothetical protein